MIKGVTEEQEKIIHDILSPYKNDFDFYYYGSRVKGNFSKHCQFFKGIISLICQFFKGKFGITNGDAPKRAQMKIGKLSANKAIFHTLRLFK